MKSRPERMTAEERRESVLDAAVHEFATFGLHGASTEAIAERAGISQPYIFKIFGTKKDLFLATAERVCDRVDAQFEVAAEAARQRPGIQPHEIIEMIGKSFVDLMGRREELLVLLQSFAACADPDVLEVSRRRMRKVHSFVQEVSGGSDAEVQQFMAYGMLLTVSAGMSLPEIAPRDPWARKMITFEH